MSKTHPRGATEQRRLAFSDAIQPAVSDHHDAQLAGLEKFKPVDIGDRLAVRPGTAPRRQTSIRCLGGGNRFRRPGLIVG